jgi:ABC-type Fe3+/spermidine/putrescine transport system ATPase subunit
VLEGRVISDDAEAQVIDLGMGRARVRGSGKRIGENVLIAVRPENIALSREASHDGIPATVASVVYHGAITHVRMIAGEMTLVAHLSNRSSAEATWRNGDIAHCRWSEESTIVLADRR